MSTLLPAHLSNDELVAAVAHLAHLERNATARLVAHLAEFDARKLHLAAGLPSLFAYCCEVLHLSEDQSGNRILAARAARKFPMVLDLLSSGSLSLAAVRLLAPHLTKDNHGDILARATHRSRREVEELIATHFPRPDVVASIRKVPERTRVASGFDGTIVGAPGSPALVVRSEDQRRAIGVTEAVRGGAESSASSPPPVAATPPPRRAVVAPLAPTRYEIRFTASAETREKLQRAQEQLRHAIPTGDLAEIFDRALTALIADLARRRVAALRSSKEHPQRATAPGSRHIPARVKRAVWIRDGGQCAYVAHAGRRCAERGFLEFHHVRPHAVGGEPTNENIELRCRAHNGYEADLFFGPMRGAAGFPEPRGDVSAPLRCARASPG
jgi:hypothetical protein